MKAQYELAASCVKTILQGSWSFEFPDWADASRNVSAWPSGSRDACYTRAVQTAEAFVQVFSRNPGFKPGKFLKACGL